ncbi:hypothetical protein EmuJ_001056600 [Echinococcus multilocularis]|uniref:Uncharacterized protein n=1 Tax=Echinococcus multilocularis TaxID=6211 RepID=A0A068YE40_ECHMU|nr:hypothetical protein EmuJ_001056600 [Echinococcus multilocularis]
MKEFRKYRRKTAKSSMHGAEELLLQVAQTSVVKVYLPPAVIRLPHLPTFDEPPHEEITSNHNSKHQFPP